MYAGPWLWRLEKMMWVTLSAQSVYSALGPIISAEWDNTWETKWLRSETEGWHLVEVKILCSATELSHRGSRCIRLLPSTLKSLTLVMIFSAASGERFKCKEWNSIVAQHGWWMSNIAVMTGRVRSEGEPTPASITWVEQFWCDSLATTTFSCDIGTTHL